MQVFLCQKSVDANEKKGSEYTRNVLEYPCNVLELDSQIFINQIYI